MSLVQEERGKPTLGKSYRFLTFRIKDTARKGLMSTNDYEILRSTRARICKSTTRIERKVAQGSHSSHCFNTTLTNLAQLFFNLEHSTMKLFILCVLLGSSLAFTPVTKIHSFATKLYVQRRDILISGIATLLTVPGVAVAKPASTFFYDEKIEFVKEESQMPTGGKVDLNSAFVVSYK
jgi:hypothetical protein